MSIVRLANLHFDKMTGMKSVMNDVFAAISLLVIAFPAFVQSAPKPGMEGWISMFDGKSLEG